MAGVQAPRLLPATAPDTDGPRSQPGPLQRLVRAVMAARQRQADLQIARYIERNGGRMTDALERGIEERAVPPTRGL